MKLPFAISILVTSAYASVLPYHGPSAIFVSTAYSLTPTVSLLATVALSESMAKSTVAVNNTKMSLNAPAITSLLVEPIGALENQTSSEQLTLSIGPIEGPVTIKGASSGSVTLLAPSDNRGSSNASSGSESGGITGAAGAIIADDGTGPVILREEGGLNPSVATGTSVIGPSTGAIVIAGPIAIPATLFIPTVAPILTDETSISSITVLDSGPSTANPISDNLKSSGFAVVTRQTSGSEGNAPETDINVRSVVEGTALTLATVIRTSQNFSVNSKSKR